ncbi:unnamed protein product [Meganyctiphanes norvegica]|uniref:Uncharacterized protein n=1 Tax=Meganyctiphanes norvegica TaxID=48144 RepID=A0AAV2R4Y2_MEGNR
MSRPEENLCQLDKESVTVFIPDRAVIDKELTPILAELVTLGPSNDQHPAIRNLFNWLVNSQRTGEEFTYVIGELIYEVCMIMEEHFLDYMYNEGDCTNICKIAAESLAIKCPVLEGPWEHAAWALVMLIHFKHNQYDYNYSAASDYLCAWTIHVIGDPDICPNPYLRYELMILLTRKVSIDGCNQMQAIASVLSACSSINIEYMSVNVLEYHKTHKVESVLTAFTPSNIDYQSVNLPDFRHLGLHRICNIFLMLASGGCLLNFDKKLAKKLLEVKSSRCSAIIYDVGYHCAVNPKRLSEPRELSGLIALLKTINGDLCQIYKGIHKESCNMLFTLASIQHCSAVLFTLINNFKTTCQTSILSDLIRLCIIYILKIVLLINVDELVEWSEAKIYRNIIKKLAELLTDLPNILRTLLTSASCGHLTSFITNINLYLETL